MIILTRVIWVGVWTLNWECQIGSFWEGLILKTAMILCHKYCFRLTKPNLNYSNLSIPNINIQKIHKIWRSRISNLALSIWGLDPALKI